jgi:biopolymer transport protein ExbD
MKNRRTNRKNRTPIQLDFSPMSALGFMLIAFFQVNCLINTPQVMPLQMYEEISCRPPIKNTKVITLLCAPQKVYFYYGITEPKIDSVDYGNDLRKLILDRKEMIKNQFGVDDYTDIKTGKESTRSFVTILIKATSNAPYGRVVDVLDEMNICEIKFFHLVDIYPREEEMIKNGTFL